MSQTIFIKGMMCVRCTMAVHAVLEGLGLGYTELTLGSVKLNEDISAEKLLDLDDALRHYELELVTNRNKLLVERIKIAIITIFEDPYQHPPARFSEYLSKKLFYNYTHLSNVFSLYESNTIERYYIETRLRKAKDLLLSDDTSINSVAVELGFNSAAHFCIQFKKLTGKTPRGFRKQLAQAETPAKKHL